mmetsp:Transcript_20701/g.33372  ORF Transcript_20701/g.33372 Transcript_20701/m.33372 type:complete len:148 (+) Transcript_20701:286-729(+)
MSKEDSSANISASLASDVVKSGTSKKIFALVDNVSPNSSRIPDVFINVSYRKNNVTHLNINTTKPRIHTVRQLTKNRFRFERKKFRSHCISLENVATQLFLRDLIGSSRFQCRHFKIKNSFSTFFNSLQSSDYLFQIAGMKRLLCDF